MVLLESAAADLIADQSIGVVKKILQLSIREIKKVCGLRKDVHELETKLTELGYLLAGASAKPITNLLLIKWVTDIQTVVTDVEDLLDEWYYEYFKKIRTIKPIIDINNPASKWSYAQRLEPCVKEIEVLSNKAKEYGIEPVKVAGGHNYDYSSNSEEEQKLKDQREFVEYQQLYGRRNHVTDMVDDLKKAKTTKATINVVGIFGMAGVGKTTLSKKVYKDDEVNLLFDEVISVTVSHDYDMTAILQSIAGQILSDDKSLNLVDRNAIIKKLKKKLKGKPYLLVLDDVWDTMDWTSFRLVLDEIGGSEGTTILVTSRTRDVLDDMDAGGMHKVEQLYPLDEDDSWSFFLSRMSKNITMTAERNECAKSMVNECGGLPLAIKVLGDLLKKKSRLEEWQTLKESQEWKTKNKNGILPSLRLSYKYLTNSTLKTCFSYCAIFEEDEEIDKHRLIHLWMAQGFLQQNPEKMEAVGEECFNELLNSSLFHEPVFDHLKNVKTVKMHDLVRILACKISKGEIWCYNKKANSNDDSNNNTVNTEGFRHVSIPVIDCAVQIDGCKKLRTCIYKGSTSNLGFLKDCTRVRALSIQLDSDSKSIRHIDWKPLGKLKHVRYLEIKVGEEATRKFIEKIELKILKQVVKLYHLQTLCISTVTMFDEDLSDSTPALPEKFANLVNLRHILFHGRCIGLYKGLGQISSLQTLPTIRLQGETKKRNIRGIRKEKSGISDDLQKLKKLKGTLAINNLEFIETKNDAERLGLGNKSGLTTLALSYSGGFERHQVEIMEVLKPHNNLIDLKINQFRGTQLPTWLTATCSLSNLVSLCLINFEGVMGNLNLGKLNSLRILKLKECNELSISLPSNGFNCCTLLEKLIIVNCGEVDIIEDMSPLTRLRSLTISGANITTPLRCSTLSLTKVKTYGSLLPEPSCNDDDLMFKSVENLTLLGEHEEELPEKVKHFVQLKTLKIFGFEELKNLPEWLGELKSLGNLELFGLPKLECLPSEDAFRGLSKLTRLHIMSCKLLSKKLSRKDKRNYSETEHSKVKDIAMYYNIDLLTADDIQL